MRQQRFRKANRATEIDRVTNYYPFGLEFNENIIPVNSITKNYRYSTQGQEKQEDTKWSSFKWRNYDPTIGRFFTIDPLSEKYAYQSHYNFSENRVVDARELEGLEAKLVNENTIDWRVKINNNLGRGYSETLLNEAADILSQNGVKYNIIEDPNATFTMNLAKPKIDLKNMELINGETKMDGNTYDGDITSKDDPRTIAHELGHKAGQVHIFDESSKISNTVENKNNLFNSKENPNEKLQYNKGTELKQTQSNDMKTHIKIIYENKQRAIKQNKIKDNIQNEN